MSEATLAIEAFRRRRLALSYLQIVGKNAANHPPEEYARRMAVARVSYNKADELYRKLARVKR